MKKSFGRVFRVAALLAGLLAASAGHAAAMLVTQSATISGSLNGASFFNQPLLLRATANSDFNVQLACCTRNQGFVQFTMDGIGSGTFTNISLIVVNQTNGAAGFGDAALNRAILYTVNPLELANYFLNASIGPVVGTASFNPGQAFPTSAGSLVIQSSSNVTFTAIQVVPVPAAAWLLASALAALGRMRRVSPRESA
jgi:hypothetical protein